MKVNIKPTKNPAVGWDVDVAVSADSGESIAYVEVDVDDFPELKEPIDPPEQQWEDHLTQQGQYPGDNKVLVIVTNDKGDQTRWSKRWS